MNTVIIGIHGLRNKPPKYVLTKWWKKSIQEGFKVLKLPLPPFTFEMAYWAHFLYEKPQNPTALDDPNHPQYLPDPYVPGTFFGPRDPETFKKKLKATLHQELFNLIAVKTGFMNVENISNMVLRKMFSELDVYYHQKLRDETGAMHPAKELLRNELINLLKKYHKQNIMLIAHSMGTIIAYDVLMHDVPDIPVHTFITLGCPLGFPVIMNKIKHELGYDTSDESVKLPTPNSIQHKWLNYSDLDDVTCLNYNLRNNYTENVHGIRQFDHIVYNNYEFRGVKNPHKAYGYLRTSDITQAINNFLVFENANVLQRLKWVFSKPTV